jgi:hypothetical protein
MLGELPCWLAFLSVNPKGQNPNPKSIDFRLLFAL